MFKLSNLMQHENITIQCHDFPDADALASAFALYKFFLENGKKVRIIYGGKSAIAKPNLVKMIELLSIPAEYVTQISPQTALVTVDCQYGENNVTKFPADFVYQIDHHIDKENGHDGAINSNLGSCATLVWSLLLEIGFPLHNHSDASTALYYGLYSDTANFEEISHPLDKDMRDKIVFDQRVFNLLRFSNLTINDLHIAGIALTRYKLDIEKKFAVFKADECDPNILGFISDLALQVEEIDVAVVYNTLPGGYKLSVRSCTREIMANDLAKVIAGGDGHKRKAGGFIPKDKLGVNSINTYLISGINDYYKKYDTVHADNHDLNINAMPKYRKQKIPVGCVLTSDVFPVGTPMQIRTLEGDSDCISSNDVLLMIGPEGEVYPITKQKFEASYKYTDSGFIKDFSYMPMAKNIATNESVSIAAHARSCLSTGETLIHAAPLTRHTKVFTRWSTDGYMLGVPGDYIAVRSDDYGDVYIIKRHIFEMTYERV